MKEEKIDKANEAKSESFDKAPQEFMWFSIRMVPKETFNEFKAWCKKHAGNKMNVGLQMLLDIAKLSETTAALFEKMNTLEAKFDLLQKDKGEEAELSVPKTLGGNKEVKKDE